MARKSVAARKKDEHENRNAIIVGFLLALLPIIIFLWAFLSRAGYVEESPNCSCPPPYDTGSYVCCMASGVFLTSWAFRIYMSLPTLYVLIYLPLEYSYTC